MIERRTDRIVTRYLDRALEKDSDKVLCHVVDKIVPSLSRIEGEVTVNEKGLDREWVEGLMKTPESRAAVRKLTDLMIKDMVAKDPEAQEPDDKATR